MESQLASTDVTFSQLAGCAALSRLLLCDPDKDPVLEIMRQPALDEMLALAGSHHVVIRAMEIFARIESQAGRLDRAEWAMEAIEPERARVDNAVKYLAGICTTFEQNGCDVTVIKSLDHWPDLGSDIDLYTNSNPEKIISLMKQHWNASLEHRSWGDRLANKWNFQIPGLPELVEIHMGRLGQTGEQVGFASGISQRARRVTVAGHSFAVTSPEDRIMICTLQRMYRHFYARLCDIVDTVALLESDRGVNYDVLRASSQEAGIWDGVATFLVIVSDYVKSFRGYGLDLPPQVRMSASFGVEQMHFARGFLRISIIPHSARLYATQLGALLLHGNIASTARLSLLPCLATAAAVGHKITGSDKGIW